MFMVNGLRFIHIFAGQKVVLNPNLLHFVHFLSKKKKKHRIDVIRY